MKKVKIGFIIRIKQNPVNRYVGQIKGGGVYYCSSESWAKGFGPQIAKL